MVRQRMMLVAVLVLGCGDDSNQPTAPDPYAELAGCWEHSSDNFSEVVIYGLEASLEAMDTPDPTVSQLVQGLRANPIEIDSWMEIGEGGTCGAYSPDEANPCTVGTAEILVTLEKGPISYRLELAGEELFLSVSWRVWSASVADTGGEGIFGLADAHIAPDTDLEFVFRRTGDVCAVGRPVPR